MDGDLMRVLCEYQGNCFVSEPFLTELNGLSKIMVCEGVGKRVIDIESLDKIATIMGIDNVVVVSVEFIVQKLKQLIDRYGNEFCCGHYITKMTESRGPITYKVTSIKSDGVLLENIYDRNHKQGYIAKFTHSQIKKEWMVIK